MKKLTDVNFVMYRRMNVGVLSVRLWSRTGFASKTGVAPLLGTYGRKEISDAMGKKDVKKLGAVW